MLPAASSLEGILSRAFLWLHLLYHTDPLLAGLGACRFGEQLFYDFHIPLLEEGVGSDDHCCEEPKLVLILSAFHHSITLAGLGGLPSDMTQTFIPGYLNPR